MTAVSRGITDIDICRINEDERVKKISKCHRHLVFRESMQRENFTDRRFWHRFILPKNVLKSLCGILMKNIRETLGKTDEFILN